MTEEKWLAPLSTTERNNIGLVQVRQSNINSETWLVPITQNSLPLNFLEEGITQVFFCTKFGVNPVEQRATIIDAKKGHIKYTMNEHDTQKVGLRLAYFKFEDDKGNFRGSTQTFTYHVIPSIESSCSDGGTYIVRLEELFELYQQYMNNQMGDWESFFEAYREIIESIDPSGVLLKEIVEARKSKSGEMYPNLKERLDSSDERMFNLSNRKSAVSNDDMAITKLVNLGLTYAESTELHYGNDYTPYSDKVQKNSDGFYELDCSSFVLALLKGVSYRNSRYFNDKNYGGFWRFDIPERTFQEHLGKEQRLLANHMGRWCYENGFSYEIESDYSNLQPGDIVFFENSSEENFWRNIGHVGIWLGNTKDGFHQVLQCGNGPKNTSRNDNPVGIHSYNNDSFTKYSKARMAARLPLQSVYDNSLNLVSIDNLKGGTNVKLDKKLENWKVYTLYFKTDGFGSGVYPIIRVKDRNIFTFGSNAEPNVSGWYRAVFSIENISEDEIIKSLTILVINDNGDAAIKQYALYEGFLSDFPNNLDNRIKQMTKFQWSSEITVYANTNATINFEDRINTNVDLSLFEIVTDVYLDSLNDDKTNVFFSKSGKIGGNVTVFNNTSKSRTVTIKLRALIFLKQ